MKSIGMSCIKYLLFSFNLIFAVSGVAIIIAGAVVLADVGEFRHFMENRILAPPVILIVVGVVIFLIAFLGCYGAIRESYKMLIVFAACLVAVFMIEMAVGIAAAVYKGDFENVLKKSMTASMGNYNSQQDKSSWDNIQTKLKCCGVDGASDWPNRQVTVPHSCCYNDKISNEEENQICTGANTGAKYLAEMGCYEKLKTKVHSKASILIGVGIGIAFIQVVGVFLATVLAARIRKEEKEDK